LIVTLGTPFVLCRRRRVEHPAQFMATLFFDSVALLLAVCVATFVAAYVAPPYYESVWEYFWKGKDALLVSLLALLPAWFVFLLFTARLPDRLLRWIQQRQDHIVDSFRMSWLGDVEILSIAAERDEAGAFLVQLHRWASIPSHIFERMTRLFRTTRLGEEFAEGDPSRLILATAKVLFYVFSFSVAAVPLGLAWAGLWQVIHGKGVALLSDLVSKEDGFTFALFGIAGLVVSAFLLLILLSLLAQVLMLIVPPFVRAHRLGFGGESPIDNWLADIHTADDPSALFNRGKCIHREIPAAVLVAYRLKARLRHSQLYCADTVAAIIAEHINRKLMLREH
jgi:hypothetical protein